MHAWLHCLCIANIQYVTIDSEVPYIAILSPHAGLHGVCMCSMITSSLSKCFFRMFYSLLVMTGLLFVCGCNKRFGCLFVWEVWYLWLPCVQILMGPLLARS
jgi:hypothetical protein